MISNTLLMLMYTYYVE